MGRKSEMTDAPGRFGTSARIVEFVAVVKKLVWKKWVMD